MSDFNAIAKQFTEFYYNTFDQDRNGLTNLYRDSSMLTWESEQIAGSANIIAKLASLPFSKVVHRLLTLDAQPSTPGAQSIIVVVTGQLLVDDGSNVLQYTQMFHLVPEGGSYFVQNDVFRLVYG